MLKVAPILFGLLAAGYAVAESSQTAASHAPGDGGAIEVVATVALAAFLMLGVARFRRKK